MTMSGYDFAWMCLGYTIGVLIWIPTMHLVEKRAFKVGRERGASEAFASVERTLQRLCEEDKK